MSGSRRCWETVRLIGRSSDSDEEVDVKRGRNVQHLQAEGRRRVREEDRESVFGIQKKLRRVIPLLKAILDTQRQREVKHEADITGPVEAKYSYKNPKKNRHQKPVYISCFCCVMLHTAEMTECRQTETF